MSHHKIVIGNWKMNPGTLDEAKLIIKKTRLSAQKLGNTEVVVCPPFPFIQAASSRKTKDALHIGAQSVSEFDSGAHTGEVSVSVLKSMGVEYVLAGHSEERGSGDTDEMVSRKVSRILEGGLAAVVCIGEKDRGENGEHLEFLKQQMKQSLAQVPTEKIKNIIVAYEPIWAIGAKEAMKPEDVYEMSLFVKKIFADMFGQEAGLKVRVLYGGSVNFRNAGDIINIGKVDGLLVGRESVNLAGFPELLKAVDGAK